MAKVQLFRLHDGKFLTKTDRLKPRPRDLCLMDAKTICVLHVDGLIQIVSIASTDILRVLKITRSLRKQVVMDEYHGVVRFKDNLVVSGVKRGLMCWCIVSLHDGHVDAIHEICKGDEEWCRLITKDNMVYISCDAGVESRDNTGVYGFDILNPSQCKYKYKHQRLERPRSIVINEDWNIFVCNFEFPDGRHDYCIHQLTASCQLVAIFTQGIPMNPRAMFWDNGHLYVTCWRSSDITVFTPVYQVGLIRRLIRSLGLGRLQKKLAKQGEHRVPEVLVSDERKQPGTAKTSAVRDQGVVDKGLSSIEREVPPAIQVTVNYVVGIKGSVIPVEILRMDDKSLQLYKEALQDGKEKVYNIRVMVVGQFGVGKTTLIKHLLGQHVDISEKTSTEGIDVYKHCYKIALDTGEWIVQHEDSDQLFRLQRLVKLLTRQTEARNEGSQTEGIFQRETTEDLFGAAYYCGSGNDDTSTSSSESDFEQESDNAKHQPEESYYFKVDERTPAMDASGVNIQESGRNVTSNVNATTELLQLIVEKAEKLEKRIVEYAALTMWDFAGQYVFYTTHQTFLTCRAIYLLVIDLSQQVTDLVKDDECYFDTDGVKLCKVQDLVDVWLNSIDCCAHSYAAGSDPKHDTAMISPAADTVMKSHGASTPGPSLDVGITVTPPVILVGTHVDKIRQVIPHSLVEELNQVEAVPIKTTEQLDLFLRFQHEKGNILYFRRDLDKR